MSDIDLILANDCSKYYADPLGWVMWAFDWGHGDLEGFDGPDVWQADELREIGQDVIARGFDGVNPVDPIRRATASGHGIGKSALTSWIILWIMSTRPHAKGIVTANTSDQLRTKTWAELGKWRARCITGHWFEYNNGRGSMSLYYRSHPESWRVDGQTCREENSESFAGLHSAQSTPFYIFDEASSVPDVIWEVAEGGLTDGEPMFLVYGNPTRNTGKFKMCFGSSMWSSKQIDSRTSKMTNKRLFKQWANAYDEDSDFFRVRVRGRFPRAGDMQYIPNDVVKDAMTRDIGLFLDDDPLICGIDLARGGGDDCRIVFRRGYDNRSLKSYKIPAEKSRDSMRVVSMLTMLFDRHKPDASFLDVGSMGGPIGDRLRQLGYRVTDVGFGHNATDGVHYANKVTEMWARMLRWLMDGGAIPDEPELEDELTSREYGHDRRDRLELESKKLMKARIGRSPDWSDALCLTFAQHVAPVESVESDGFVSHRDNNNSDYDPLDCM